MAVGTVYQNCRYLKVCKLSSLPSLPKHAWALEEEVRRAGVYVII